MPKHGWYSWVTGQSSSDTTVIQVRTIRYHQISDNLRERLAAGDFVAGGLLPSEAALGEEYRASRVTIRKALEVLRVEGLVDSRQGLGWFVAADPVSQALTGLSTIERQLAESGRSSERQITDFGFVQADTESAAVLGARVLEVRRINMADGQPFARVTVWCREDLGSQLSKAEVEQSTFYELLPIEFGGASQRIGAAMVEPNDAADLGIPEGSAVLVVNRTTHDAQGSPVLMSEHVFPGHLTEFVVELPSYSADEAPSGLRLVE